MKVRRVEVANYKGIKEADWRLPRDRNFYCLIGPGDSSKSTLLEAIHLALSDRWNLTINDTDFYAADTENTIVIRVTVADLPEKLLHHKLLGMHLSGINAEGDVEHDPIDGFEPCILIELRLDRDVEPTWTVVRPGDDNATVPISASVRRQLDVFKVDDRVDIHLRWSRASALSRLTDATHGAAGTLAAAVRAARHAVFSAVKPELADLTSKIQAEANSLAGGNFKRLRPGLDSSLSTSGGNLALFEGDIPLTNFGLGSRRLVGVATQQLAVEKGAVILVDEVEHGLEPHRLVHLLRNFKENPLESQVFVTTHSSVAVEQLNAHDLVIVRNVEGVVTTKGVPGDMTEAQGSLRSGPSSFLARRVVVGEGRTEYGLLLGLVRYWDEEEIRAGRAPTAALGVAVRDGGGGSPTPVRARVMQELGYETAVFMDNDVRADDVSATAAETAGALLVRWSLGFATEDELTSEMESSQLSAVLKSACISRGDSTTVLNDLNNRVAGPRLDGIDVAAWLGGGSLTLDQAREVIAGAAKASKWFKGVDNGRVLADLVYDNWGALAATNFGRQLELVRSFMYEGLKSAKGKQDG